MPITFKSQATGNLVMLQAHAEALLRLLGKTATQPGVIEVSDMPRVLGILHGLAHDAPSVPPASLDTPPQAPAASDEDEAPPPFQDEPVSLRQRAAPFIRLIEQAQAGQQPVVWGV
ncbi:MAG: DUF1840 domain-containing protein [Burkholderiales bacterium]|nr:DUF1840 domain-containing protein [Burkholderiales bacterium]MBH2015644.1 DUF1840 domain-containing protein [Burkholderiales bacterium]